MTSRNTLFAVCIILCICIVGTSAAQDESQSSPDEAGEKKSFLSKFKDPDDGWFDASGWLLENIVGFMPVPIIITEPAVDNGLGLAGVFFHKPKDDQMRAEDGKNLIMPNISALVAGVTGNDSWFAATLIGAVLIGAALMLALPPGAQAQHDSEDPAGERPTIEGREGSDSRLSDGRDEFGSSFDEGDEASRGNPDRARRLRERWRSATPEERDEMRRRHRERIRNATPEERERMRARRRELMRSLPPEEREAAIRGMRGRRMAGALEGLSPDERRQIRARLRALPPEERREVIRSLRRLRELPPDEREELRARMLEVQELPDEDRAALRERSRRWEKMPPEEKARLREQMKRLKSMTPEEQLEVLERALDE